MRVYKTESMVCARLQHEGRQLDGVIQAEGEGDPRRPQCDDLRQRHARRADDAAEPDGDGAPAHRGHGFADAPQLRVVVAAQVLEAQVSKVRYGAFALLSHWARLSMSRVSLNLRCMESIAVDEFILFLFL